VKGSGKAGKIVEALIKAELVMLALRRMATQSPARVIDELGERLSVTQAFEYVPPLLAMLYDEPALLFTTKHSSATEHPALRWRPKLTTACLTDLPIAACIPRDWKRQLPFQKPVAKTRRKQKRKTHQLDNIMTTTA